MGQCPGGPERRAEGKSVSELSYKQGSSSTRWEEWWGLMGLTLGKHLAQCLAHGKGSTVIIIVILFPQYSPLFLLLSLNSCTH